MDQTILYKRENGQLESRLEVLPIFAKAGIESNVNEYVMEILNLLIFQMHMYTEQQQDYILETIQKANDRINISSILKSATLSYKEGEKKNARKYLYYSISQASDMGLDISKEVSEIKKEYKDKTPLFFLYFYKKK